MQQYPTDTKLEATRRRIAERIRHVCANMPDDEFERLVMRMALIEWKHAQETAPTSWMP